MMLGVIGLLFLSNTSSRSNAAATTARVLRRRDSSAPLMLAGIAAHARRRRTGSVGPRPLRCHADSFAARPALRPLITVKFRVGIGVAGPFILAVRVGIKLRTVARLRDHRLGHYRGCGHARQDNHRSKEPRARHWFLRHKTWVQGEQHLGGCALPDIADHSAVKAFAKVFSGLGAVPPNEKSRLQERPARAAEPINA
jgi:hypothetical protein